MITDIIQSTSYNAIGLYNSSSIATDVVPVNSSLLTTPLHSLVRTILIYNDTGHS